MRSAPFHDEARTFRKQTIYDEIRAGTIPRKIGFTGPLVFAHLRCRIRRRGLLQEGDTMSEKKAEPKKSEQKDKKKKAPKPKKK